jgi:small subunit ribosomal protein S1
VSENFTAEDLKAAEEEYTAALKPGEDMVNIGEAFGSDALAGLKFE